ncbi:dynein associated protein domain-containing protein [Trichoderma breve]|uniref:Dynein associated protein domain-containing protein n=1 Tax=Trichoderma breve TaxID=2034170 RepID=A0A9W9B9D8_9HYPO|nr:dynein associated protein domain-containing protein [Trichoderma breve]KAJ4859047.1 dynein associated protein domain-containing protein [Trichoderma breve]
MPDFKPGQTVLLNDGRKAIVRFAGPTHFQVGEWIGVELEEKTGKNDGSVQGERYFDCPMGYGMFVKPMMATIIAQPAAPKPAAAARKPAARPSGFHPTVGRASISGGDANLNKRRPSINAPSPSPVPHHKPSQSSSNLRSPSKSPTKQLSGSSSASVSRTGTPSTVRVPSAAGKPRTALPSSRTSMGPPPPPQPGQRSAPTRPISGRGGITAPKGVSRPESGRRTSTSSQGGRDSSSATRSDELLSSPIEAEEDEILSPQPTSPSAGRANALERIAAESSVPSIAASLKKPAAAGSSRSSIGSTAASREIEDLKAKLKVLERKRVEDRDKLKQLDTIQGERDKFEGIIQKLQQKYQPIQQENTDLRKAIKEAEARFESVEALQAEHDTALELATLDREMAEETSEVLKMEVDALKEKAEELQLELDILKEENAEYSKGMTPEERASTGWLQMERTNERLREALLRLRDLTQEQEQELRDQIASMEEELKEFNTLKEEHTTAKEKLAQSESAVEDLRQQLDTALGAEDMIEDLTERNMSMSEQIEELKAVIEDLENLKEINDELEINHVQNEKEMQEELDFRDSVIAEQARRAQQQDANLGDMEYTLSRFRELVTNLQSDLDDMRASQAVTEGESEKLNDRSRAMMDLNMKLQISASKAQVKTIDLELRRLEAQEAEQHLEILKLFLPDSYRDDQDSVLALLRFRRLAFKANLVNGFIRERVNGQPEPGHEDDVLAGCEAIDKLVWVASMCDRFVNDISHCTIEQFTKYQNSLLELEPVERALNSWIDGLRRDELKEQKCADELQRTISLMSHLGEVHISSGIAAFADDIHMRALIVQSHLDSATVAFNVIRSMVQRAIPAAGEEDELAQHFAKKIDLAITQTRSTKVFAGKAVRALEDLKARSLSLGEDTKGAFEQCETLTQELARLTRDIGLGIHKLLTHDEGRNEPFTYGEVNDVVRQAVLESTQTNESDLFSSYLNKLKVATEQISDLASLAADLDQTHDYDVSPSPWRLRAQELRILKTVPVDTEEELRRLKAEHNEIETLESRMRDAQANIERIGSLQSELEEVNGHVTSLKEDIEKQDRELKNLESERDKWKKIASDSRAYADGADAADMKAGQERAVATAREMDALKKDIESLQAAVRYLRDDNRRARMKEQQDYEWLSEPLKKEPSSEQQRKALVVAEGRDVLGELLKMATSATVFDLSAAPKQKLAWRPARTTPQYHAAKQTEELEAWRTWQESVLKKTDMLFAQDRSISIGREKQQAGTKRDAAARLRIRLPRDAAQGKLTTYSGDSVQIVGSQEWDALQAATRKFAAV